jgi:HPt (histidine-containing phosphotransfer) domain-containing protein
MPHLNLSFIIENVSDEPEFIVMLLGVFKSNLDPDLDALRASLAASNHDQIKKDAHKIKSSFRSLGMNEMTQTLQNIEDMGKNEKDIELIRQHFAAFEQLIPAVLNVVDDYISTHSA